MFRILLKKKEKRIYKAEIKMEPKINKGSISQGDCLIIISYQKGNYFDSVFRESSLLQLLIKF